MSRNTRGGSSGKPASGGGSKVGPLFAGILFGILVGLMVAGVVAWYILNKNPATFENKVPVAKPAPEAAPVVKAPVAPTSVPASGTAAEEKPHFEFYKVLTDKADTNVKVPASKEDSQPTKSLEVYYVQAGSFSNSDDAEKLKAKLALLGMESNLQAAAIPNKGTYHRVRVGPFRGEAELNKALATLKQNGIDNPTLIKVQ